MSVWTLQIHADTQTLPSSNKLAVLKLTQSYMQPNCMFCRPCISIYMCKEKPTWCTSIFRQPLHVSGVSTPIIRRYNRMCTIGTHYSFWMTVYIVPLHLAFHYFNSYSLTQSQFRPHPTPCRKLISTLPYSEDLGFESYPSKWSL